MNCPSCGKALAPTKVGAADALACPDGHGFWLDPERARALAAGEAPVPKDQDSAWPQRNILVHAAVVAAYCAAAWALGRMPATGQVWSLQSVSQLVVGFSWLPYLALSTVLVLAMRTRRWGAVLVHGLMLATLAGVVGSMWRPSSSPSPSTPVTPPPAPPPKFELVGWSLCASADPPYATLEFDSANGQIAVERLNGAKAGQRSLAAAEQPPVEAWGGRVRVNVRLGGAGNEAGWTVLVAKLKSGAVERWAMWAEPGPQGLPPMYQSGPGTPARPLPAPRMECQ